MSLAAGAVCGRARVIGIGQDSAGDDGVGLAVVRALRAMGPPPDLELLEAADAVALVPLLETERPVVLVDAVVTGSATGRVLDLPAEQLAKTGMTPSSTHGLGVGEQVGQIRTDRALHHVDPGERLELGSSLAHRDDPGGVVPGVGVPARHHDDAPHQLRSMSRVRKWVAQLMHGS